MPGCVGVLGIHCTFAVWVSAYHNSWYAHNNSTQTYNIRVMWPKPQTACLQKFNKPWQLHSVVSACYKCGGRFPLWCLHDENLSSVIVTKRNHLYFTGYLFIYVGFLLLNSVSTFYIYMAKFWETVVYKKDPLWFILFSRQIWYRIWVWAAVYKLKKHERCFYRICWKKMSCSAPDGNRIAEMFHFIHSAPKKTLKEKNVTSGVIFYISCEL